MKLAPLGNTGLHVSPLGFGAFKIGRNRGIKYPSPYDLPDEPTVERLLNGVLDLGVNYIDTAPAYGLSEERIGTHLAHRRDEFVLSTKVGETFEDGQSTYDFSAEATRKSIECSLRRMRTEAIDIVFVHADGNDLWIQRETGCVPTLLEAKAAGKVHAVGFSGKTIEGAKAALAWSDVLMVEYHRDDVSHESVIAEASGRGVGVVVKKGLSSGRLSPEEAIPFVLRNPGVGSLLIGGLNHEHWRSNIATGNGIRELRAE